MPHYGYGFDISKLGPDAEIAKAQQYNIDASFKDLCAVCDNIRGMQSEDAVKYLDAVADGHPVLYRRWNTKLGHRRELDGQKGRYPIKAAKYVAMVLQNAIANANAKGLANPKVIHAAANKQAIYPRMQAKGRQIRADYETAKIEIILIGSVTEEAKKQAAIKKFVAEEAGKKREEIKEAVKKKTEEKVEKAKAEGAADVKPAGMGSTVKAVPKYSAAPVVEVKQKKSKPAKAEEGKEEKK
jgi:ribosomal protein uL22